MGLYSGGLIIRRIFASEIWEGGIFRRAYFWGGLLTKLYDQYIRLFLYLIHCSGW